MVKSVHIFYSGLVQGVGFRLSAERVASGLEVTGWVKNLDDGRVEVFIEGDKGKLEDFIDRIDGIFHKLIVDVNIEWGESEGKYNGFDIIGN